MEQTLIEKILCNYNHLKGKYLGCFCKDEMSKLIDQIKLNIKQDVNPSAFALINMGETDTNGEHWMGLVINKTTNSCGYFDSFQRNFKWLNSALMTIFDNVHKTNHVVQVESSQICGLHMIYFIECMMDPKDLTTPTINVNVGQYVRKHYDTTSTNVNLKDKDIVNHLSKKFKMNFDMLLKPQKMTH